MNKAITNMADRRNEMGVYASTMMTKRNLYFKERNIAYRDYVDNIDKIRLLIFDGFLRECAWARIVPAFVLTCSFTRRLGDLPVGLHRAVIPVCVSLCGGLSCAIKRSGLSMFMGLSFIALMAVFFALSSMHVRYVCSCTCAECLPMPLCARAHASVPARVVQYPIAIFLADNCPGFDEMVHDQLETVAPIPRTTFNTVRATLTNCPPCSAPQCVSACIACCVQIVNISNDLSYADVFDYFTGCRGERLEVLRALDDPRKVLAGQGANFTEQLASEPQAACCFPHSSPLTPRRLAASAEVNNFTTSARLRPNIVQIFEDLHGLEDAIVLTAQHLNQKLFCNDSANVYQPFKNEVCDNFAGED